MTDVRITREIEDIMVVAIVQPIEQDPLLDAWLNTQAKFFTLRQYEGRYPCPEIEFISITNKVASTTEEIDEWWVDLKHDCVDCYKAIVAAGKALESGQHDRVGAVHIKYQEAWPSALSSSN